MKVSLRGKGSPSLLFKGKPIGTVSWYLGSDPTCLHFEAIEGGFQHYRDQIPLAEIYPMATIAELEIGESVRRKGLGTAALRLVLEQVRNQGAKVAFLRVGWDCDTGGSNEEERRWRTDWYMREGFMPLKHIDPRLPPLLWHPLERLKASIIADLHLIPPSERVERDPFDE